MRKIWIISLGCWHKYLRCGPRILSICISVLVIVLLGNAKKILLPGREVRGEVKCGSANS